MAEMKKPTIKDVAAAAGVSHPTASRVLNGGLENYPLREETIRRVREAAARLNYRPNRFAQTLKTRRSHLIGISLGNFSEPGRPFDRAALESQVSLAWADLIHGACQAGWRRGYQVVLVERRETASGRFERQDLFADVVDGLLYISPTFLHQEYLDLSLAGTNIVIVGYCPPEIQIPSCDIDNRKACHALTRFLIERGSRRIAYVFNESREWIVCGERIKGFQDALAEAGLRPDPGLMLVGPRPRDEVRAWLETRLRQDSTIDGVLFAEWGSHHDALQAARAAGRVCPDTLRIAGFCDGWPHEAEDLGLTCMHIPLAEMAYESAELLISRLEGDASRPLHQEIQPTLKIRKSA